MIELTSETFHQTMGGDGVKVCLMHRGPMDGEGHRLMAMLGALADADDRIDWAHVDLDDAADLTAMFGLDGERPHLLMMADRVVLYSAPADQRPAAETAAILKRAAAMDMDAVRRDLETERESRSHLFARRVCPTAMRGGDSG